jgi:hypothetical protein
MTRSRSWGRPDIDESLSPQAFIYLGDMKVAANIWIDGERRKTIDGRFKSTCQISASLHIDVDAGLYESVSIEGVVTDIQRLEHIYEASPDGAFFTRVAYESPEPVTTTGTWRGRRADAVVKLELT